MGRKKHSDSDLRHSDSDLRHQPQLVVLKMTQQLLEIGTNNRALHINVVRLE